MRVINEEIDRHLMKTVMPDVYRDDMSIKQIAEVLQKNGDRVRRTKTFRQSMATKLAWQKYRDNFQVGINRFQRNNKVGDLYKNITDRLKNWGKVSPQTSETQHESFDFTRLGHFDVYEFMGDISLLEAAVLHFAGTFALEEQYVEASLLADSVIEGLSEFKKLVSKGEPVPSPVMEILLSLVEKDLFGKESTNEGSLSECYSKLLVADKRKR